MKVSSVNNINVAPRNVVVKKQLNFAHQSGFDGQNSQIFSTVPLNLHKNQLYFGRTTKEHESWGATINPNGTVNFKTYTFDDAKKVYVEILKSEDGERVDNILLKGMNVKRGRDNSVKGITSIDGNSDVYELLNKGEGIFERKNIPNVAPSKYYRFIVVDKNDIIESVKDPYSKRQSHVMGWSRIYNPDSYKWSDDDWMAGKDVKRISRLSGTNLKSVGSSRIMEVNIPTLTPEGTFKAAKPVIRQIALKNLANAIEIMPLENCYSKQWGYDGVDKFAINEKMGTPDEFKELIDYAHKYKLNVIIDMVPNHIGPDGDTLRKAGPYEKGDNDFGSAINYEGKGNRPVRDWMTNAALHWAREYHADGIRFDMTKPQYMGSDFTLKQFNVELNEHFPHVFTIAEDGENNRSKITTPVRTSGSHQKDMEILDAQVKRIEEGRGIDELNDIGFNSEWDFVFLHSLEEALANSGDIDLYTFDAAMRKSATRVSYPISHDEQGNLDGTSAITKSVTSRLKLSYRIDGSSKAEMGQKAAHAAQAMLELYANGKMDKMNEEQWRNVQRKFGIRDFVSKNEIRNTYNYAVEKTKLGLGTVFSFPGPKMMFQGFERASLDYFKFFRDFSENIYMEEKLSDPAEREKIQRAKKESIQKKGYDTSINKAYRDNNPGRIQYSAEVKGIMNKVEKFATDANRVVDKNPALQDGEIIGTTIKQNEKVHAAHCKKGNNEIFSIKNFSDREYTQFDIHFPAGKWVEILNSNDAEYAGNNRFVNKDRIFNTYSNGGNQTVKMGSNNVMVFKRVG